MFCSYSIWVGFLIHIACSESLTINLKLHTLLAIFGIVGQDYLQKTITTSLKNVNWCSKNLGKMAKIVSQSSKNNFYPFYWSICLEFSSHFWFCCIIVLNEYNYNNSNQTSIMSHLNLEKGISNSFYLLIGY